MSESLTKLRETISAERDAGDPPDGDFSGEVAAYAATDAALAAVEQEMADLRKRPTLEEVEVAMDRVCGTWPPDAELGKAIVLLAAIRALYAEKAPTP